MQTLSLGVGHPARFLGGRVCACVCGQSKYTSNFTLLTCSGQGPIIVETCANEAVPQGKTDHLRVAALTR